MIRERREKSDMIRLFLWGLVAIILFLAMSFKPVYGHYYMTHYDFSEFNQPIDNQGSTGGTVSGPVFTEGTGIFTGTERDMSGGGYYINGYFPPYDKPYNSGPNDDPRSVPSIPEPATLLFFGIGIVGAGIYRTLMR